MLTKRKLVSEKNSNKENVDAPSLKKVKQESVDNVAGIKMTSQASSTSCASNRSNALQTISSNIVPSRISDENNNYETDSTPSKASCHNSSNQKRTIVTSETLKSKKTLVECLKKAVEIGAYCVSGEASELPSMIGMEVKDFGPVVFPLVRGEAKRLIKKCHPVIVKYNEMTRAGKSVPKSFQLFTDLVAIKNPDWDVKLKELVARVGKSLGCQDEIDARLKNVIISEKGSFLSHHQENERDANVMGTLIIQPPSFHKGGNLIVYNNNSQKEINFGQDENATNKSAYMVHYAAYTSDSSYEIRVIEDGFRLILIYTLYWTNGCNNSLLSCNSIIDTIYPILDSLNSTPHKLGFLLDNRYTSESLTENGFKALTGNDRVFLEILQEANRRLSAKKQLVFYICRASLVIGHVGQHPVAYSTQETTTSDEKKKMPSEWAETARRLLVNDWHDSEGKTVFPPCSDYSPGDFKLETSAKIFSLDVTSDETTSDPLVLKYQTHVWGEQADEHIYHRESEHVFFKDIEYAKNMLIAWPKRFEFDLLLRVSVSLAVEKLYETIVVKARRPTVASTSNSSADDDHDDDDDDDEKQMWRDFKHLMNHLAKHESLDTIYDEYFNQLFEMLKVSNDLELIEMFIRQMMPSKLHSNFSWELAEIVVQFGYDRLRHVVDPMITACVQELIVNCTFIMDLLERELNQTALNFFNECVLKIVTDAANIPEIWKLINSDWLFTCLTTQQDTNSTSSSESSNTLSSDSSSTTESDKKAEWVRIPVNGLVILSKCLSSFQTNEAAAAATEAFSSLADALVNYINETPGISMNRLADAFAHESEAVLLLRRCAQVRGIFKARKRWLREHTRSKPEFSWSMPNARLDKFPAIEKFLQESSQSSYYGFNSSEEMHEFLECVKEACSSSTLQFSIKTEQVGLKTLVINKTQGYFDKQLNEYIEHLNELNNIMEVLSH